MTDNNIEEYKEKHIVLSKQVNDASIESSLEFDLDKVNLDSKSSKKFVVVSKVKRILDPDSTRNIYLLLHFNSIYVDLQVNLKTIVIMKNKIIINL